MLVTMPMYSFLTEVDAIQHYFLQLAKPLKEMLKAVVQHLRAFEGILFV